MPDGLEPSCVSPSCGVGDDECEDTIPLEMVAVDRHRCCVRKSVELFYTRLLCNDDIDLVFAKLGKETFRGGRVSDENVNITQCSKADQIITAKFRRIAHGYNAIGISDHGSLDSCFLRVSRR